MEFLKAAGKTIQRANFDVDDLIPEEPAFKGEFQIDSAHVRNGDQIGLIGEGTIAETLISGVDFTEARLAPLTLSDVRFDDVNLANAVLRGDTARRVEFVNCQATGLQLHLDQANDIYAEGCRLDLATIEFRQVKNAVVFRRCSFRETIFRGDLSNVVFDECELVETEFDVAKSGGCDFTDSTLVRARGILRLSGARITSSQASSLAAEIASEAGLTVVD